MAGKRKRKRSRESESKLRRAGVVKAKPKKTKPARPAKSKPKRPRPTPARPAKPNHPRLRRARVLSKHPEAVRSRSRRVAARPTPRPRAQLSRAQRERRALHEALIAERLGLSGPPRIAPARPRGAKRGPRVQDLPIDALRELAIGWLEALRDIAATIVPTSLDVTDPSGRQMIAPERAGVGGGRRPWLIVGRFDFLAPIDYEGVAEVLSAWRDDFALEVAIHPDRLSQIRIVYEDPKERRGDGDDFISQIGAWPFVVSELIFEIAGTGVSDEVDKDSLMARYAQSVIPRLYVYFSPDMMGGVTIDIGREVVKRFKL